LIDQLLVVCMLRVLLLRKMVWSRWACWLRMQLSWVDLR